MKTTQHIFTAMLLIAFLDAAIASPAASLSNLDDQSSAPLHVDAKRMSAKLKHLVQPTYPEEAKTKGIEGTVTLHTIVAPDGSVGHIDIVSGPAELIKAAVDAVRRWQYEPTIWKGKAVEVDTTIDMVFQLHRKSATEKPKPVRQS